MNLSVLAHALSNDLVESLRAARRANFSGVVLDPIAFPVIADPSQTARREIVRLIEREGLTLVGIDVRLDSTGFSPRGDIEREADRVRDAIDLARGLRTNLVSCDLGPLPPAPEEPTKPAIAPAALGKLILPDPPAVVMKPETVPRDLPFEASLETGLQLLAERADAAGCLIAFRSSLGSFASLAAALRKVDCGFFGVDLDTAALLADAWDADAVFSAFAGSIRHIRARDAHRGAGGRLVPAEIGKGSIDWPAMIARCRDAEYDGFLTIDSLALLDRRGAAMRGAVMLMNSLSS